MKLLTAHDYYDALLQEIPRAKKRLIIQAMVVVWGGRTEKLLPLIEDALARKVQVTIVGDIFSKYESKTAKIAKRGPYFDWDKTLAINKKLVELGARVTYVGKLRLNPFRRRCHSKIIIIDDTVYTFGGVNFSDSHFTYQDQMIEAKDKGLADRLALLVHDIEREAPIADYSHQIDGLDTLLFDGGTPRSSVIYDTACEAVAQAKRVFYVSKMCPTGRLANAIRKTDYRCYFNRPALEGIPENMAIVFDQLRNHIRNDYRGNVHLHAKFILTENHDGSRHLITGSNNFSWRGVKYGTKEIALHSTDPLLWDAFYSFLQEKIAK